MSRSRAYNEGIAAGKLEAKTEFDNPYAKGTVAYDDWYRGFCYIRGAGDTMLSGESR